MFARSREREERAELDKRIEDLLNEFDFHKVRRVMALLNWTWVSIDGIPTVDDLRKRARYLLREASKSKYYQRHVTGGFIAERDDDGALSLYFYVDHVEEYLGE